MFFKNKLYSKKKNRNIKIPYCTQMQRETIQDWRGVWHHKVDILQSTYCCVFLTYHCAHYASAGHITKPPGNVIRITDLLNSKQHAQNYFKVLGSHFQIIQCGHLQQIHFTLLTIFCRKCRI